MEVGVVFNLELILEDQEVVVMDIINLVQAEQEILLQYHHLKVSQEVEILVQVVYFQAEAVQVEIQEDQVAPEVVVRAATPVGKEQPVKVITAVPLTATIQP